MNDRIFLNSAEHAVAARMGLKPTDVVALIGKHGRSGLAGVALFANAPGSEPFPGKRQSSPFPPATDWKPSNPGTLGTEPVRTVVEPEDSDGEDVKDPAGVSGPPRRTLYNPGIGVTYPDGSTSASRKRK
jgi:hypothetical protein